MGTYQMDVAALVTVLMFFACVIIGSLWVFRVVIRAQRRELQKKIADEFSRIREEIKQGSTK